MDPIFYNTITFGMGGRHRRPAHSDPHRQRLPLHPQQPGRHRREDVGAEGLDHSGLHRAARRGGLRAQDPAWRHPRVLAVHVPDSQIRPRDGGAGPDRLRVRARRHVARALAGARRQRHRRQIGFPGRAPLSHRRRPEGPAAQGPARRHLRDQHDAVRRRHRRARLRPCAQRPGAGGAQRHAADDRAEDDADRAVAGPRRHPGGVGEPDEVEVRGLLARACRRC